MGKIKKIDCDTLKAFRYGPQLFSNGKGTIFMKDLILSIIESKYNITVPEKIRKLYMSEDPIVVEMAVELINEL